MMHYKVLHPNGVTVERFEFDNAAELEEYFLCNLALFKKHGLATKVIGNVLLLWNKDA
jgi:hypothetical protein